VTENNATADHITDGYKRYVLFALTGVYIFNFIDRQILVILQESIKADLHLSDTQLGLLTGFAFALFYVTLGIPIARLADKYNRKKIIAISLTLWSGMTAISGLTTNFVQLLLARIGVGIGEAGGSPPAHSMISDYFPADKRATALATYSMGIYIGILIGFLFGGWFDEFFGWRNALMAIGLPGILYAVFFYFTVKEPPRGYSEKVNPKAAENYSILQVFQLLVSRKSFLFIAFGVGFHAFVLYGFSNWTPSFLARLHGMQSGEIGTWLALASGGGGALGIWLGGVITDRFGKDDKRWYMWIPTISILVSIPFTLLILLSSHKYVVLFGVLMTRILWNFYLGPCIAMAHSMVGLKMRALTSAILFLFLNLIGLGLGPLIIGMISDFLNADYGNESLRWALSIGLIMNVLVIYLFWSSAKFIRSDIERAPI